MHHAAVTKSKSKPVVHVKKPAVARPVVPVTSTPTINLPADVPSADSGAGMSTRSVLLLAFVVAIGAGVLALLVGAGWRRLWWWRRYHSYPGGKQSGRAVENGREAVPGSTAVQAQPAARSVGNGSNGAAADDGSVTIVTGSGADAPTGT